MATTATRVLDNYIAGRWTPAQAATDELDVTNPATGEVLARVPLSGAGDLDAAAHAAQVGCRVRRERPRARGPPKGCGCRVRHATRHDELARSVTTEMGK